MSLFENHLIAENKRLEEENKKLNYEVGYLQGRLMVVYQRLPRVGMVIEGNKFVEPERKGGVQ